MESVSGWTGSIVAFDRRQTEHAERLTFRTSIATISSRDLVTLWSCRRLRMYMSEGSERGYFSGRTILATTLSLRMRRVAFFRFPVPPTPPSSASAAPDDAPTTRSTTASTAAYCGESRKAWLSSRIVRRLPSAVLLMRLLVVVAD